MKPLNKKGFTLIEVLISMLLLGIVMTGGIALYFHADELMTLAVHKKIATEMVNSHLEDLKSQGYAALTESIVTDTIQVGGISATRTTIITDVDEDDPPNGTDYKQIDLTLTWQETWQNDPRTIEIVTLVTP